MLPLLEIGSSVLVACEVSGIVRDAFIAKGHKAISCDLLPSQRKGPHYIGDAIDAARSGDWDLMIAHPPCTYISNSSAKHLYAGMKKENGLNHKRYANMVMGAMFFKELWELDIPRICIENPVMLGYAQDIIGSPPTQSIQPWQHGHPEKKRTCLWLKNLPPLVESNNVYDAMMLLPKKEQQKCHYASPSSDRGHLRSITYEGLAKALADQWSNF